MERGRIVKALSGFYYVDSGNGTLTQCRARGRFRKERMSPLVGDWVRFSGSGAQGMVEEIEPRRNSFIRPAVSNLDALVVLASGANPVTDPFLIDRVAAIAGNQNVPVVLCVNKTDLESGESLTHIYRHAGFPVFPTSAASGEGVAALHEAVRGKTVAFTGNSGVGKSSILNCLGFSWRRARFRKSSAAAAIRRAMWSCSRWRTEPASSTRRASPHLTRSRWS